VRPHHERHCNSTHWSTRYNIARRRQSFFGHIAQLADDVPAHDLLKLQVDLASGHPPSCDWKRRPGRYRNKWIDQLRTDTGRIPADLRRSTVQRDHAGYALTTTTTIHSAFCLCAKCNKLHGRWVRLTRYASAQVQEPNLIGFYSWPWQLIVHARSAYQF